MMISISYMGGISQDVKRLKIMDFNPFFGFFGPFTFFYFDENYHVF